MILKDTKGNLFQLDDLLFGSSEKKPPVQAKNECQQCPYEGMCQEEAQEEFDDAKVLFFEISVN